MEINGNRWKFTLVGMCLVAGCCAPRAPLPPLPPGGQANPEAVTAHSEKILQRADLNHDGRLDRSEFARTSIMVFEGHDKDGDDALEFGEISESEIKGAQDADSDGDRNVSFAEMLHYQAVMFKERDLNGNGYLERDEIEISVRGKLAKPEGK